MSERYSREYCDDHGIYDSRGFCPHCKITDLEQQLAEKWIPVGERLPEPDTPVLAISNSSGKPYLTTAMRIYEDDCDGHAGYVWAQLCSNYQPSLSDPTEYAFDDDYNYTHWQPLPAPPKERSTHG